MTPQLMSLPKITLYSLLLVIKSLVALPAVRIVIIIFIITTNMMILSTFSKINNLNSSDSV